MEALRGRIPLAAFVLLGAASMVVLQVNHQSTIRTLHGTVAAVDNLTHARLAVMEAYLSSEQIEAGDPTFTPTQLVPELTRAADLVDDLRAGRTSLLAIRRGIPLRDDALVAAVERYGAVLAALRAQLQSGVQLNPAERRSAFAAVDDAASTLEAEFYDFLQHRLSREDRRHRVWLFGWASFLCVTALALLTHRREHRRADEARQLAERNRARSEAHFRSLIEHAPDLIFLLGPDGVLRYESPSAEGALGYTLDELTGRDYFDGVHPQDRGLAKTSFEEVMRMPGVSRSDRYRYRRKSGEWRWLESTATNLLQDPAVESVVINTRDVTERVLALNDLRESERRHATLLQAIPDLIFRHTRTGDYLDFQSPEGSRDLFVAPDEIRGRHLRDLLPPEIAEKVLVHTEQALAAGAVQRLEYALRTPAGVQTFEARVVPSGPDEVLSLVRNVTEQRRSEERERALLHEQAIRVEAEAANRAKNEFLSRMSHELRTPLNAILGFGQLLEMEATIGEDQESIEQILKAGQHLLSLIDEVLDIARIEAGEMYLTVAPVSVRGVVQESLDLVRLTAAKQGISIRAHEALASRRFVKADRQRLKQVLLNLLSNAIKYNRQEGTITVSCQEFAEGRLRISVSDTGNGIPADKLGRIFTPFDRLGADQTGVEGTGLGLALSEGLMGAMGGGLGVESVRGQGSRFWAELPVAEPEPDSEPVPRRAAETEHPNRIEDHREKVSPTHTVLFIEDNLANVRLMERLFQRRPLVRLLTAMQGSLGLELAREHLPDVILLDLNLPDLSGDEVLIQLRNESALRDTPVIMISGDAIPSQVERTLGLGARAYITKPFDVREVLDLVDEGLAASSLLKK